LIHSSRSSAPPNGYRGFDRHSLPDGHGPLNRRPPRLRENRPGSGAPPLPGGGGRAPRTSHRPAAPSIRAAGRARARPGSAGRLGHVMDGAGHELAPGVLPSLLSWIGPAYAPAVAATDLREVMTMSRPAPQLPTPAAIDFGAPSAERDIERGLEEYFVESEAYNKFSTQVIECAQDGQAGPPGRRPLPRSAPGPPAQPRCGPALPGAPHVPGLPGRRAGLTASPPIRAGY
jgi:hypothetical protein